MYSQTCWWWSNMIQFQNMYRFMYHHVTCASIYASASICASKCIKMYQHVWVYINVYQSSSTWIRVFNLYQVFINCINLFNSTIIVFFKQVRSRTSTVYILWPGQHLLRAWRSVCSIGRQDAWTHQFRSWRSMHQWYPPSWIFELQPASSSYCLWDTLRCVYWRDKHLFSRNTNVTQICAGMKEAEQGRR